MPAVAVSDTTCGPPHGEQGAGVKVPVLVLTVPPDGRLPPAHEDSKSPVPGSSPPNLKWVTGTPVEGTEVVLAWDQRASNAAAMVPALALNTGCTATPLGCPLVGAVSDPCSCAAFESVRTQLLQVVARCAMATGASATAPSWVSTVEPSEMGLMWLYWCPMLPVCCSAPADGRGTHGSTLLFVESFLLLQQGPKASEPDVCMHSGSLTM